MNAEEAREQARGEAIRVLHVDDDPSVLDLTADFLRRESAAFEVRTAEAVAEALDVLDSEHIDCVVSDLEMPDADGLEFLATVRERDGDLPFVLFTGKGSEEIASEAIAAGVTGYLQKGPGLEQYAMLANRVQNAVERHRAREALREERRRFELVARASADAFWDLDLETNRVERSDGFARLFGYDDDEVGDDREWWRDRIHPEDRERVVGSLDAAIGRGADEYDVEYRFRNADGSYSRVASRGFVVTEDGEPTRVVGAVTDVTGPEDRAVELERYATIVEASGDPVYALDASGRYTFVNEAHTDLLGYETGELLGQHVSMIASEGDVERAEALIRELLASGRRHGTIELTLVTAAGERVPVENHLALLTDDDGGFRGTAGILRDVSEREERERVLEALHEATRRLVRAESPEAVARLTAEAAEEVLGYVENTVRLLEDDDRLAPQATTGALRTRAGERPVYRVGQEPVGLAFERGEPLVYDDAPDVDDDVDRIPGATMYVPIGRYGVMTVSDDEVGSLDETDVRLASLLAANAAVALERLEEMQVRREGEEVLRRRERSLEALHDATRRLMTAETKADAARLVSETAKDVLGYPVSSVRLVSEDGQQLLPVASVGIDPERREPYGVDEGPSGQVLTTGEPVMFDDLSVFGNDYTDSPVESMLVLPIGDHGALAVGDTGAGAFEESERQLASLLAANAATVLDRIEQARGLEKQNERLEEFANVVSHDLRNPLNVAAGRLELVRKEREGDDGFDQIDDALMRMNEIIDDVLSLARGGEEVVEPDAVALRYCVDAAWETAGSDEGRLVVEGDLGTVSADRSRLRQLFENLFVNAVEHAGPGATVRVGRLSGDGAGFFVEDDGPGIPVSEREAVFQSGYTTGSGGTGFGLAIVSEIADAHGWEVAALEGEDGGARFEFTGVGTA